MFVMKILEKSSLIWNISSIQPHIILTLIIVFKNISQMAKLVNPLSRITNKVLNCQTIIQV